MRLRTVRLLLGCLLLATCAGATAAERLAHELQLQVVAEGVEEESAVTCLRSIDCDLAQGYLFDRPQPPEKLEATGWLDPDFSFPRKLAAVG